MHSIRSLFGWLRPSRVQPAEATPVSAVETVTPSPSSEPVPGPPKSRLGTATKHKIRIHIAEVDSKGGEKDLGPWPDDVAEVRRIEDAFALCSMLSYHLRTVIFPKERAS